MTITAFFMRMLLLVPLLFGTAQATLTEDLQGLVGQGDALDADLGAFSFETGGTCSQLGTLNTSIEDYIAGIEALGAQLSEPLSLTQEDLTSLEDLSALARSMAEESLRLALEVQSIDDAADLVEYRAGLSAMLRLSDDIGTMADRILEMADRILLMADNIGAMADKIVYTITLQSANMAVIEAAMLTTQENMVRLNASLTTIAYNLTLGQLVSNGGVLASDMNSTVLDESNMASELVRLESEAASMEASLVGLFVLINTDSGDASHYLDGDTLTYFTDLSEINLALAMSIERYADSINQAAPLTQTPVLSDATASMLRLAQDIKVMGDRIMEMSARIVVMADNIGIMSGRIVEVQGMMNDDMALSAASLGASQRIIVDVIGAYGL
jgi:hypothetical protein